MRNGFLIFFLLTLASPQFVLSQTSAADWFRAGLNATTNDEKIRAFEKVIELEPDYIEAYYYLGLVYKAKQRYNDAELTLNKAYFKNPYALNKDTKTRILFELGSVYTLRDKFQEAEEALKGAKALTSPRDKIRGHICYELGRTYLQRDEIELALAELAEGKQLLPQDADRFNSIIEQANQKKTLEDKYNRALALLNKEHYQQAIELFDDIRDSDNDFKDVSERLKQAQTAFARQSQKSQENAALAARYEEAISQAEAGNLERAIELLQQVVTQDPQFKDANQRLQNLNVQQRARVRQNQQKRALERSYQEGVTALRDRSWQRALAALEKVAAIDANYKNTSQLIVQAERALQDQKSNKAQTRSQKDTRLEELYLSGVSAIEQEEWRQAFQAFKELKSLDPDYKDIDDKLKQIRDALKANFATEADSLHQVGVAALQNGEWRDAVRAFEKVKIIDPDYEQIDNRLADARFNLERSRSEKNEAENSNSGWSLTQVGMTLSIFLIPLVLGFIAWSPGTRARFYLIRGNYAKAAEMYERILRKKPDKHKLYPILANLYLLENRRDPQAMHVFETVVKLKLPVPQRREINSIIASHYLTEGRNDSTAIAVLEQELEARLQKPQNGTQS